MFIRASFSAWSILGLGLVVAGCGDGPPDPGFDDVGGGDGQGGTNGTSSNTTGATSTGNTSANGSTSASSSTSGSTAASTSASTGSGCNDTGPGEPNGTEATAHDLGNITDSDGDEGTVNGVLAGVVDKDWYRYDGEDTFSAVVDPTRTLTSSGPVRICKYLQCVSDTPVFTCPTGATASTSPDGRPGCCDEQSFTIDFTCGSTGFGDEDAAVYVRVDTAQNGCISYTLKYHF